MCESFASSLEKGREWERDGERETETMETS